ncbi:hypothetical protein ATANTOWER_028396 [Ataeniobius toweri]|uniref:Transposase Tc1-like domain-containing protein n=1 Tax=Ataeniobius toweri TaxID=208326 RepID=A0ABU7C3Z9_9TELE|nr:hypothetical protein [Ataeniobius toweri]
MFSVTPRTFISKVDVSAASIIPEVEEVGDHLVSGQTIRHTLHQIGLHGCHPTRMPLLKMKHKKACKQFAEDKQTKYMDYWNNVLWLDETKINYLVQMMSSVCWPPGKECKGESWFGAA